jgi:glutaredoxin
VAATRRSLWGLLLLVLLVGGANTWWQQSRQQRLGQELATRAAAGDIRLLSSDTCALCVVARGWLKEHRVPFTECSIERDTACRALFEATRAPGTPVLLVRGQAQVGFSPQRVLQGLQQPG